MPKGIVVDNKFIGGLKTEFTGLNYPQDSAIETYDMVFTRTGEVKRRKGIDFEESFTQIPNNVSGKALSSYVWKNVNGNGEINILVQQVGSIISFYDVSNITNTSSVTDNLLPISINLDDYDTGTFDITHECQCTDGNGYLFILHPSIDPLYVEYISSSEIVVTPVIIQIRDLVGIAEDIPDSTRPLTLTDIHKYNLYNQGWSELSWSVSKKEYYVVGAVGSFFEMTIAKNLPISDGDHLIIRGTRGGPAPTEVTLEVTVDRYNTNGGLRATIDSISPPTAEANQYIQWTFSPAVTTTSSRITKWFTDIGNYPSDADIWWYYKDEDGKFNPQDKIADITVNSGPAPKGYYILDVFEQDRSSVSGIDGLERVTSQGKRPSTGTWFQGRIWYSGVSAKGYNENIYFSQIIEGEKQFGRCYQTNDPTSEERFDLLPSDGGVITAQGMGDIHKLFPTNNGLLVFASKGIWFITGSTGIGFTANDYTITRVSEVETLSHSSFVNVQGNPVWWNQEGIYILTPDNGGSYRPQSLTNTTIASFYQDIPIGCKYTAKGYYNPVTFQLQYLYRDTPSSDVTQTYQYDRLLNFDTQIQAFYPWKIDTKPGTYLAGITLVGGSKQSVDAIPLTLKYLTVIPGNLTTFSEERDINHVDWSSSGDPISYESYFITGARVQGQGMMKTQLPYVSVYSADYNTVLDLQARWDNAIDANTFRWSVPQTLYYYNPYYKYNSRKARLRGQGLAVQIKMTSVANYPMSVIGWVSSVEAAQSP